jgi:hypothetical protein
MAIGDLGQQPELPLEFKQAAHPAAPFIDPPKVMVSLPLDADVLAWFQSETEPSDWQRRINDLLRFHRDSILQMEADWEAEASMAGRETEPGGPSP